MQAPFNVGDEVRAVDVRGHSHLKHRALYVVTDVYERAGIWYVLVSGSPHEAFAHRFVTYRAAPMRATTPTGAPPDVADRRMILSEDAKVRKDTPITTGVLDYFPRALAAVAQCSKAGNDQHNPGQPLHWAKGKSTDHADCISRHLIDRHTVDTDGIKHAAKLAWRALALLETILEDEEKK